MQGWGVVPVSVWRYDDLNILIERHQKAQEAFNGELPELTAQHLGYIGLAGAK